MNCKLKRFDWKCINLWLRVAHFEFLSDQPLLLEFRFHYLFQFCNAVDIVIEAVVLGSFPPCSGNG